jgi:hypothetical protein
MSTEGHFSIVKAIGDISALAVVISTIAKLLPPLAALFAIIWYCIGYYEKITGKSFSESRLARWFTGR